MVMTIISKFSKFNMHDNQLEKAGFCYVQQSSCSGLIPSAVASLFLVVLRGLFDVSSWEYAA